MESSSGGSFIPKRNVATQTRRPLSRRVYLFGYIAYIFFFGTLLAVAGIFFLNFQADKKLADIIIEVDMAQESIDSMQISEIKKFDWKIKTANTLLNNHLASSKIFGPLEETVVDSIAYTSFTYAKTTDNAAEVNIQGSAEDLDAVLYQRSLMMENPMLARGKFSSVMYGDVEVNELGDGNASTNVARAGTDLVMFDYSVVYEAGSIGFTSPGDTAELDSTPTQSDSTDSSQEDTSGFDSELVESEDVSDTDGEDTEVNPEVSDSDSSVNDLRANLGSE